jgi:proline racemase
VSDYFVEVSEQANVVEVTPDVVNIDVSGGPEQTSMQVSETPQRLEITETGQRQSVVNEPAGRTVYMVDFLHIQVYS